MSKQLLTEADEGQNSSDVIKPTQSFCFLNFNMVIFEGYFQKVRFSVLLFTRCSLLHSILFTVCINLMYLNLVRVISLLFT